MIWLWKKSVLLIFDCIGLKSNKDAHYGGQVIVQNLNRMAAPWPNVTQRG